MSQRLAGKVKEGRQRAAVGGSIYTEDPYLSNLLTARPTRHSPEYLKSKAKAFLFPSLSL